MSEGSAQEFSTAQLNLSYGGDDATHKKRSYCHTVCLNHKHTRLAPEAVKPHCLTREIISL